MGVQFNCVVHYNHLGHNYYLGHNIGHYYFWGHYLSGTIIFRSVVCVALFWRGNYSMTQLLLKWSIWEHCAIQLVLYSYRGTYSNKKHNTGNTGSLSRLGKSREGAGKFNQRCLANKFCRHKLWLEEVIMAV